MPFEWQRFFFKLACALQNTLYILVPSASPRTLLAMKIRKSPSKAHSIRILGSVHQESAFPKIHRCFSSSLKFKKHCITEFQTSLFLPTHLLSSSSIGECYFSPLFIFRADANLNIWQGSFQHHRLFPTRRAQWSSCPTIAF